MILADALPELAKPILFVEARFLWIFAIIFLIHWALRSNTARKVWLLVASHCFYTCFFIGDPFVFFPNLIVGAWEKLPTGWWFPVLLWGSTIMDYFVGIGIEDAKSDRSRRGWVIASLVVNLGVLSFFKYYGFFEENVRTVFAWLHLTPSWEPLKIFLPYGISFYTFQSLSYSLEVYRKHLPAERSFLNLAFFIAFFPQVVAGPIVRALTFLPQTCTRREWATVDVRGNLTLFFIGFVKKACIGDFLATVADTYFSAPQEYNSFSAWAAILCYAGQIYCDFSGYSDMAIAVSRLLGYELCVNFNFPYFANSITDFWRRWHMSLSSWLRDYLYISLGGNRGSKLFTYRNLMLTMLLGGLWHGASWAFVVWGALHGGALVFHREWTRLIGHRVAAVMRLLAVPITFYWVLLTWVPFRAADVFVAADKTPLRSQPDGFYDAQGEKLVFAKHALTRDPATGNWHTPAVPSDIKVKRLAGSFATTAAVWKSLVLFSAPGKKSVANSGIFLILAALCTVHWLNYRALLSRWWRAIPDWAYSALLGAGCALALFMKPVLYKAFIYFQF